MVRLGEEGVVQGEREVEYAVDHGPYDGSAAGFVDAEDAFCGKGLGDGGGDGGVVGVGSAREDGFWVD